MLFCWTTLRRYRHFRCSTIILAARQKVDTPRIQLTKSTGIHQLQTYRTGTQHFYEAAAMAWHLSNNDLSVQSHLAGGTTTRRTETVKKEDTCQRSAGDASIFCRSGIKTSRWLHTRTHATEFFIFGFWKTSTPPPPPPPVDESRPNWRLLTSTLGSIGLLPTVISTFVSSSCPGAQEAN
ncbi:hypothetical protein BDP81DRAFT_57070 [Colletotrichum phormii]|uniref:Uncharacterized protein n=1 Tax=Colletotrichum phormii TaxID=359342 RepID=A0AAJ0EC42_9PEZI|nr:uncharacterized protein BDP81DRAFT_57070 [Colletotrichum phormii]KAK1634312.1 hypothetical protein BDP81DRAFT_57070 [Colletotrichum phormii]